MADPKYANLPGIDIESKDVYECGDLPEEDQNVLPEELSSTSVELVKTEGAFEKFSGKYVSGMGKDFSGRIQSSKISGYNANQSGLAAPGEAETALQKFNRLKIEVNDLLQEVNAAKSSKESVPPPRLMAEVESLQMQLSECNMEGISKSSIEATSNIDQLMSKLKTPAGKNVSSTQSKQDGSYQLYLKPDYTQEQTLRVSELEQRLARLEKVLGSGTDNLNMLASHSKGTTLRDAVQTMEAKLSLLDPDRLPQVDSRLQAVLNKVNEINKAHKGAGDQQSEMNEKISDLYDLVRKWEGVRVGLPQLIDRLRALDTLHAKASDFTAAMAHLDTTQSQIKSQLHSATSAQKKLEGMFNENVSMIESNIVQLNKRMSDLKK